MCYKAQLTYKCIFVVRRMFDFRPRHSLLSNEVGLEKHFQILHSEKAIIPNEARFKLSVPQLLGAYLLPVELLMQALTNE